MIRRAASESAVGSPRSERSATRPRSLAKLQIVELRGYRPEGLGKQFGMMEMRIILGTLGFRGGAPVLAGDRFRKREIAGTYAA